MEMVERLFADLESNNLAKVDESKRKFADYFSSTKESWLANGMMEYFNQTSSSRIVDILVKVQPPHDKFIFDRLSDWIHGPNKNQAITLFGHIVKKHPSWLFKVANHALFKDILKLLKSEPNIISIMSALYCIIMLLPIIPASMAQYLQDLFDIFMYLSTWNCNNVPRLTDDQLIHLQLGLSAFFQRLYGMYPCNFISFLRDHVIKENNAVFMHTIKPLLETVKMHPMLLTSNRDLEKYGKGWNNMEPHDVVVECSKFSLDYMSRSHHQDYSVDYLYSTMPSYNDGECTNASASDTPVSVQLQNSQKNTPYSTGISSPFFSLFNEPRPACKEPQRIDNIWSPHMAVLATPPPTLLVAPHTPTPMMAVNYSSNVQPIPPGSMQQQQQQQQCPSGASPPEAAVEATPETTPMKDNLQMIRPFPTNSTAVRSIWGVSQPSSPLKKDPGVGTFRYAVDVPQVINVEQQQQSSMLSSPKIFNFVNERSMYQNQMQLALNEKLKNIEANVGNKLILDSVTSEHNQGNNNLSLGPSTAELHVTNINIDSTQEDDEVTEINSSIIKEPADFGGDNNTTANNNVGGGGLRIPNPTVTNYAKRFQQWQIQNQCSSNSSSNSSAEYSKSCPAESVLSNFRRNHLKRSSSISDDDDNDDDIADGNNGNLMQPVPSKLRQDNLKSKLLRSKRNNFAKKLDKVTIGTQTIEQVPIAYKELFLELINDKAVTITTPASEQQLPSLQSEEQGTTAAAAPVPMSPHLLLDQYIETSIKKKQSHDNNNRDQIQLLNIQLQYERYRREVHAERNRRLLGKSRANAALEMDRSNWREQKDKLTAEIEELTVNLNKVRISKTRQDQENDKECNRLRKDNQHILDEVKQLRSTVETLQRRLVEEKKARKDVTLELEVARADLFDMQKDLRQTKYRAELGDHYKEELNRLQSEVLLMGEIQMKCKEKLGELNNLKARDAEMDNLQIAYEEEIKDMRHTLDNKTAQLDGAKARLFELESQLSRRDTMFTDQKRLLKTVKEEYQEKLKSLEEKYTAQKAVILRLEEELLELYNKHQAAVNTNTTLLSPDSADKTDLVGSLDHTSPLSNSLASSDGLSASLRSTEIRNLHPLVIVTASIAATTTTATSSSSSSPSAAAAATTSSTSVTKSSKNTVAAVESFSASVTTASGSGSSRQPVSEDIPVPATSQHHHHHLLHHHHHQK